MRKRTSLILDTSLQGRTVARRAPERQDLPEQHVGQAFRRDPRGYTPARRREQAREEAAARRRRAAALAELQEDEELLPRLIDVTFICAGLGHI